MWSARPSLSHRWLLRRERAGGGAHPHMCCSREATTQGPAARPLPRDRTVSTPRPNCGFPAWNSGKRATSSPAPRLFPAVPEDPASSHWEPWGAAAGRRVPSHSLPLLPGPLGHCCRRFARSQGLLALLSGTWVRVSLRGPSELAQDVGSWCGCHVGTELPAQHCHLLASEGSSSGVCTICAHLTFQVPATTAASLGSPESPSAPECRAWWGTCRRMEAACPHSQRPQQRLIPLQAGRLTPEAGTQPPERSLQAPF